MDLAALSRLLRLSSSSLPIGGFGYSQGLEAALAHGLTPSPEEAERWMQDHLTLLLAKNDAAYWWRLSRAWARGDHAAAEAWNAEFLASRDGVEMRNETLQMGHSLTRLLEELEGRDGIGPLLGLVSPSFPAAHAFAVTHWKLPPREALAAYLWTWLESQVLAYLKLGVAGHMTGQRLLTRLLRHLPGVVEESEGLSDDEMTTSGPGLSLMSYAHEVQDGRLFRS